MPLPDNTWEHLQSTVMSVQNRIIREEFSDVEDDDNISTPRASLKVACTLKDDDSAIQTLIRLWMFYGVLRKAQDFHPAMYCIPSIAFQEANTFAPQVKLFFLEPQKDVEKGYSAVEGEITFRLARETPETVTPAEAKALATKIKSAFGSGKGFVWKKGRYKVTYLDRKHGYDFRLLVTSESEGKRVIEQVLDIQSHTPDWDHLTVHESRANFPIVPGNHTIYGKSRRKVRRRPRADVRFRYAELHIHGLQNPITLVDLTGFRKNPLIKA